MHHPFSTHKNNTIVIVTGETFTARLKMWRQRFVVTVSEREDGILLKRHDYAEDLPNSSLSKLFNYAYWTMKAVLNKLGCDDAVREDVHPNWVALKQPFSLVTTGGWPCCRMTNLSTTHARPMELTSGLTRALTTQKGTCHSNSF